MQSYSDQPALPRSSGFAPIESLGLWTCLLLGAMACLHLAEFSANLLQIILHLLYPETVAAALAQLGEGAFGATELPGGLFQTAALVLSAIVALLYLIFLVITAVVFFIWLTRSYKNLRALGVEPQYTTGWVIGSWFVPLLNLVRPLQIMKELWVESDPDRLAARETPAEPSSFSGTLEQVRTSVPLLSAWWFFWIGGTAANRISSRLAQDIASVEDYIFGCKVQLIPALLLMVGGVLAVLVVRGITARQAQCQRLLLTRQPAPAQAAGSSAGAN